MTIGGLGVWEIIGILAILILLFGSKRIVKLAKDIAEAYRVFRKGLRETEKDLELEEKEESSE